MKKVIIILIMLGAFCSPAHASWLQAISDAWNEAESEVADIYSEKNITIGNVSFTLAQGWMSYDPEQADDITKYSFANEGCAISVYYQDYSTGKDQVLDEALTDTLLWSFAISIKEGKDIIEDQTKDFDMLGHSGYLDYISYQDGNKVVIAVVTSFNSGKGIVNMLYYTENTDMPFFDDYSNMISSVQIDE